MKVFTKALIRLLAIYFGTKLIIAMDQLVYLVGAGMKIDKEVVKYNVGNYLFSILLFGIIGFLLWFFSEQITNRIVTDNEDNLVQINLTFKQLEEIVFRVIGLILIVMSIEPVMKEIIKLFSTDMNEFDILQRCYLLISLLNPTIRMIIGLYLVFKKQEKATEENVSI